MCWGVQGQMRFIFKSVLDSASTSLLGVGVVEEGEDARNQK